MHLLLLVPVANRLSLSFSFGFLLFLFPFPDFPYRVLTLDTLREKVEKGFFVVGSLHLGPVCCSHTILFSFPLFFLQMKLTQFV